MAGSLCSQVRFSEPAMGWLPTKRKGAGRVAPALQISTLVLPMSDTSTWREASAPLAQVTFFKASMVFRMWRMGPHSKIRSLSLDHSSTASYSKNSLASSSSRARLRVAAELTARIMAGNLACLTAAAMELAKRPKPTRVNRFINPPPCVSLP